MLLTMGAALAHQTALAIAVPRALAIVVLRAVVMLAHRALVIEPTLPHKIRPVIVVVKAQKMEPPQATTALAIALPTVQAIIAAKELLMPRKVLITTAPIMRPTMAPLMPLAISQALPQVIPAIL